MTVAAKQPPDSVFVVRDPQGFELHRTADVLGVTE